MHKISAMHKPPNVVTSREACEQLGIDRSTLTRWVAAGRITPTKKLDGRRGAYLFHPADVDTLARERADREQVA